MPVEPGMPGTTVLTSDQVYVVDGQPVRGVEMNVTEDVFEQYVQGYRCIWCHHAPQRESFPEHCVEPYCRFPMKAKQREFVEREFQGERDPWETRSDIWTPN